MNKRQEAKEAFAAGLRILDEREVEARELWERRHETTIRWGLDSALLGDRSRLVSELRNPSQLDVPEEVRHIIAHVLEGKHFRKRSGRSSMLEDWDQIKLRVILEIGRKAGVPKVVAVREVMRRFGLSKRTAFDEKRRWVCDAPLKGEVIVTPPVSSQQAPQRSRFGGSAAWYRQRSLNQVASISSSRASLFNATRGGSSNLNRMDDCEVRVRELIDTFEAHWQERAARTNIALRWGFDLARLGDYSGLIERLRRPAVPAMPLDVRNQVAGILEGTFPRRRGPKPRLSTWDRLKVRLFVQCCRKRGLPSSLVMLEAARRFNLSRASAYDIVRESVPAAAPMVMQQSPAIIGP